MIDSTTYKLLVENYIPIETSKKQIVIGHTFNHGMKHVIGWKHRFNGKYKKTASFTISQEGIIYKHFEPKFYSELLGNKEMDKKSIVILIENDGWLLKDIEKNSFISWVGDIYNKPEEVVEKRWREYSYWAPYTEKQIESALKLIKELCSEFSIPMTSISHNTKVDNLEKYEGILYRSNLDKHYTDLSPAWNFEEFKNKIEIKID